MSRYDVFISCKSEDYKYAEEIYDFLTANGINTFLASKELRRLGESEYRRAISVAMKGTYHLIIFASNPDYIDSTFVYYEWDMFLNAKLKGFKPGNIITILKDVATDDINMDLWKYESLTYAGYKSAVLQYVDTDDSRARRAQIQKEKEEERQRLQAQEEERRRTEAMRAELTALAEGYKKSLAALDVDANKIFSLAQALGIKEKKCPVCGRLLPVSARHCATCGYICSPIEGLPGLEYLSTDKASAITLARAVYEKSTQGTSDEKIKECERTISDLVEDNNSLRKKLYDETRLRQSLEAGSKEVFNQVEALKKKNAELMRSISAKEELLKESLLREQKAQQQSTTSNGKVSPSEIPATRKDYSVWVTYISSRAKTLLINELRMDNIYKIGYTNLKVGLFETLGDAIYLKDKLVSAGATVRIEHRGKPI